MKHAINTYLPNTSGTVIFLSFLLIIYGFAIMIGWWFRLPFIVQLQSIHLLIYFNAALCCVASGLGLLLTLSKKRLAQRLQFGLGIFLIIFAGIILIESILNIDLNLDQFFTQAWIENPGMTPGRIASNVAFAFVLSGINLILFLFYQRNVVYILSQIFSFLIFFIGLLGVMGYILRLDTIFSWYELTRMILGSSIILITISICFWLIGQQKKPAALPLSQAKRIGILSAVILFTIALIVGLIGFAVVTKQYENYLKKSLQTDLQEKATLVQSEINTVVKELETITNSSIFQEAIKTQSITSIQNLTDFFLAEGFSAARITNSEGMTLVRAGQFIKGPKERIKIDKPKALLLVAEQKLFFQFSQPILINSQPMGQLTVEWPLEKVDYLLSSARKENNELLLCSPLNSEHVYCLSSQTLKGFQASLYPTPKLPSDQVFEHKAEAKTIFDDKKHHIFVSYHLLEDLGLSLVHKTDMRGLFSPIFEPLTTIIPIIILTIFAGSLVLYWRVMPLVREIISSEHKATLREKQLQDTESYTREIVENIGEGIITINQKGIIKSCNKAVSEIFGYSQKEMLHQNITKLMPSSYRNKHRQGLTRYLRTGEDHVIGRSVELEGLHKDGTVFPLELSIREVFIEGHRIFTGILRNLSYRKKAEAKFKSLLEGAPDAMVIINDKGKIIMINAQTEKLFGYGKGELLGEKVEILIPERFHNKHHHNRQGYFLDPRVRPMGSGLELYGIHKDGEEFPVEVSLSPVETEEGMLALAAVRDITERKRVEKLKNEFISVVSHELRTPLTSIVGSLSLLVGNAAGELPSKATQLLGIAKKNSERLIRLINDILDIEKIESGKMEFRLTPINVNDIIQEAIAANQAYSDKFSVKIHLLQTLTDVKINVDRGRLLQVLTNLISNAVKFSPLNGEVTIDLSLPSYNRVRVSIIDQGKGIPKEFQSRIFQKFVQADSSAIRKHEGTGLGLSISKAIVEKLGGTIAFKTKKNKGTTFYFDLPIWKERKEAIQERRDQKIPTVLICEDDVNVTNLLKVILEQHGLNLLIAHTASEAKQLLASEPIDALLLDLVLPDQDGISLIKELCNTDKTNPLPVVIISVHASSHKNKLKGGAFRIVDWVDKPIEPDRLLQVIHTIKNHILNQSNQRVKNKTPRILHIEDDADLIEVISNLVQNAADIVSASTLKTARKTLNHDNYDLVVLDLMLPDGSGAELLPELSRRGIPVVIFSAYELPQEYGHYVDTILMKSKSSNEELLQAIKMAIQPTKLKRSKRGQNV